MLVPFYENVAFNSIRLFSFVFAGRTMALTTILFPALTTAYIALSS